MRRQLTGEKRGSFPLTGSNWFPRSDEPDAPGWRADIALLVREHALLVAVVAGLSPADLYRRPKGKRYTVAHLVRGAAAHDFYHAGQIQLLKRLAPRASGS